MSQPENTNYVRRVVLPSGRAIEVVYFEQHPDARRPRRSRCATPPSSTSAPSATASWCTPSSGRRPPSTHWEVQLRCPNCEWTTVGLFDQDTVDRFDAQLDDGTEALVRDLKRLTRANMEEEFERFSSALASDAIWPMDF